MKCLLLSIAALVLLVTQSESAMNEDFCKKYYPKHSDEAKTIPVTIDASVFVEETTGNVVTEDDIVISRTYQKIKFKQYTRGKQKDFYAILDKNLLLENDRVRGRHNNCTSRPLEGSNIAKQYNIVDSKNTLKFSGLESMTPYTTKKADKFAGASKARGIPAKKWVACLWRDDDYVKDTTYATEIYYSDEKIMPGNKGDALIRVVQNIRDSKGKISKKTHDYFNYQDSVPADTKDFQIPVNLYCKHRPVVLKMPQMPPVFQFSMEQVNLGDPNIIYPKPTPQMQYHKETFNSLTRLFVDQEEMAGDKHLQKFRHITVQDFETGIQYDADLSTGSCNAHRIQTDTVAYIKDRFGEVRMRTPAEFFDMYLNQTYHYMGQHTFSDRQINTDVYTSVTDNGNNNHEQFVLYFASKEWMTSYGFAQYFPMPIRVKVIRSHNGHINQINVDFFQYTQYRPLNNFFDLTSCFKESQQMFINIQTDVNFNKASASGLDNFQDAVLDFLIVNTKLVSLNRVSNQQVVVGNDGKTDFRFTLLDTASLNKKGNAKQQIMKQSSNDVIYNQLQSLFKAGGLNFTVRAKLIDYKGKSTGVTKGYLNQNSFAFRKATQSYTSPPTFTGGAMAGLGLGMLLLSLLIGFIAFKGIKKITSSNLPDISMQNLGHDN